MILIKKIILITALISLVFSCKAQTIVPMNSYYSEPNQGAYFKDTENFLDNFVGTWKYQNGNEQLIIVLKKKLHYDYEGSYKDILYGEYKYTNATGNVLINTLDKIDQPIDESYHMISGATFIDNTRYVKCTDCSLGEWRVKSYFSDPDMDRLVIDMILRFININTIKIKIYQSGPVVILDASQINQPQVSQVPLREYTMTKQ